MCLRAVHLVYMICYLYNIFTRTRPSPLPVDHIYNRYTHSQKMTAHPGLKTKGEWDRENLQTYKDISASVQALYDRFIEAKTALQALKDKNPDLDLGRTAKGIFKYKLEDAVMGVQANLELVNNVEYAEPIFKKHVERAKGIYEVLCSQDDDGEPESVTKLKEVREMRRLAKKIVEEDLAPWEEKMGGIVLNVEEGGNRWSVGS